MVITADQPISPLQSPTWEKVCAARGKPTLRGCGEGWDALAVVEERKLGRYLYLPYGPVARDHQAFIRAVHWATEAAYEAKAIFIRVEPATPGSWLRETVDLEVSGGRALMSQLGFAPAPSDIQPRRTRCLDLRRDPDSILGDMTGTNRTLHRSTVKRGLVIHASHDPADTVHLTRLMDQTALRRGFTPPNHPQLEALAQATLTQKLATLFLTHHQERVIGALLVVDGGGTRIFAHGATDPVFRKLRAHQSAITAAVLDARDRGLDLADLYGIAPTDDPAHPWSGFTAFKASFGGHVVEHLGAWDRPIRPAAHKVLTTGRALRNLVHATGQLGSSPIRERRPSRG